MLPHNYSATNTVLTLIMAHPSCWGWTKILGDQCNIKTTKPRFVPGVLTSWHQCCHRNKVNAGCTGLSCLVTLSRSPKWLEEVKEWRSLHKNHHFLMYVQNFRNFLFASCDVTNAFPIFWVKRMRLSSKITKWATKRIRKKVRSWGWCSGANSATALCL